MYGTSKAVMRRLHDSRFATRYIVGNGIDIGSGPDPLGQYVQQFPIMGSCKNWDLADGDAQYLASIADETLDFVHSSHCLEHMLDPDVAMENWIRVLKKGGHLLVMIPDEDMYEQGTFPSSFNDDHKWTFTVHKTKSWSSKSVNLTDFLSKFSSQCDIIKIEKLDATFRFGMRRFDQTLTPLAECGIEFVLRKLPSIELEQGGRLPPNGRSTH
jgi:SAM-dependent methyltransferase